MAVVVTKGYPHKKPLFHNVLFLGLLLILSAVMTWLVLYPTPIVAIYFELYDITDMNYKSLLVALAALNFLVCFMVEVLIDAGILNCLRLLRRKRSSKKQYKCLNIILSNSPTWPPLNQ